MMPTLRRVNVYVSDLDYAREWYCQVLGFEVSEDLPPLAVELRHEDITFLLHKAEKPTVRQFWTDSMVTLAFATDNVHGSMKNLEELGVTLLHCEPQFFPVGDWFAFHDPFSGTYMRWCKCSTTNPVGVSDQTLRIEFRSEGRALGRLLNDAASSAILENVDRFD